MNHTPQPITAPTQYSSIAATPNAPAGILTLPGNLPVNFSGVTQGGNPSNFTIGVWARVNQAFMNGNLNSASSYYPIFTNSQVSFGWAQDCVIQGGFGSFSSSTESTWVTSSSKINDFSWHFVAISYAQSDNGGGTLYLYIDGTCVDTLPIPAITATTADAATLYPSIAQASGAYADIASCIIWSSAETQTEMAVPMWGGPSPTASPDGSLVVSFDFTHGTATDESGNNGTVSVGTQNWNTPCLQFGPASSALIPATANTNPGSSGDFSVMGWVSPVNERWDGPLWLLYNKFADNSLLELGVIQESNTGYLQFYFSSTNQEGKPGFTGPANSSFPPQAWMHLTVSYVASSNTFYCYVAGQLSYTYPLNDIGIGPWQSGQASQQLIFSGPFSAANFQGLSYWSKALTSEEILAINARVDPTGTPGCTAYFSLILPAPYGYTESANGTSLVLNGGTMALGEIQSQVTQSDMQAALARKKDKANVSAENPVPFMGHKDYVQLAQKLGIDPKAEPSEEMMNDPDFKASVEWYETFLKDLPPRLANHLRIQFRRNLNMGKLISKKAPDVGRIKLQQANGTNTLLYGTVDGFVPYSSYNDLPEGKDDLSKLVTLCIALANDIFGFILSLLGLGALSNAAGRVMQKLGTQSIVAIAKQLASSYNGAVSEINQAFLSIKTLLSGISTYGSLTLMAWNFVSELKWYEIGFAIASVVAQVIGWITTGGALLIAKITGLIVSFIQFMIDLKALVNFLFPGSATVAYAEQ